VSAFVPVGLVAILAIHGLGLLKYRPSASETEMMRQAGE
jgi:hypothetical protein